MPSAPEDNSNDSPGPIIDRDVEFAQVVLDGRKLLKNKKKFQTDDWTWTTELDDGGTGLLPVLRGIYHIRIEYPDEGKTKP